MINTGTTADVSKINERIEKVVAMLNEALNLPVRHSVTFGYLGNDRDITWYVFLPHPGRYGTPQDRMGGHGPEDVEGAKVTLAKVQGALSFARWQKAA